MGWLDEITGLVAFIEHFKVQGGAMEFFATAFMNNLNFAEMGDLVIIEYFLYPFLKYKSEGLRER